MINSVEELNQQPAVILLYPSGASGEFVAGALSESIPDFAKTQIEFENINRVKYLDFLGRSLNSGDDPLDHQLIVDRANIFLNQCTPGQYLILAHGDRPAVDFIHAYLSCIPVIEIVIHKAKSKLFRQLAATEKIPKEFKRANRDYDYSKMPSSTRETFHRHITVEWEDLLLTNTDQEYAKIVQFLNTSGSVDVFKTLLSEYLIRNQDYITQINAI
jgi:hypothetical protein